MCSHLYIKRILTANEGDSRNLDEIYCGVVLACYYIVTHTPDTGQRLGKHIPGVTLSTLEEFPLLSNGPINTHSWQQKTVFSVRSLPRNYKRAQSGDVKE
jgi:hypothetical protein